MAIWSRLTSGIAGFGIGAATADAISPELEPLKQSAWKNAPYKVLGPGEVAHFRARETTTDVTGIDRGQVDLEDDSARTGVGKARLDLLTELARTQPGLGELITLQRRYNGSGGKEGISPAEFRSLARRDGYTAATITALQDLIDERLSPGEIAAAIHRGLIPDTANLLRGEQPEPPFNVEAYPVYPIDALGEAETHGYDKDRLGVLVGLQGLPMGVIEAAHAYYRGIITHGDYIRAFNESNNRNEWAQAVLDYARQIPTARDFMENALRGHHDFKWAAQQAARYGMSEEDAFIIYQNQGRPLNLHQITQAEAWGAKYNPGSGDNPDPWMQAVLLGAVRPEYYEMQDALKYNLPSAFFFRVLQTTGVLSIDQAEVWYKRLGWPPDLAKQVAEAFGATSAKTDTHLTKAQTQLWTATHRSYLTGELTDADAMSALEAAGVAPATVPDVLRLWAHEANITRKALTPAQVKKAYAKAAVNAATGQPWTQEEALDALIERGYPPTFAQDYLNIPEGR